MTIPLFQIIFATNKLIVNRILFIFSIIIATLSLQSHAQISFGGLPSSTLQTRSSVSVPSIFISPDTTMEIEANQFAYPNEVNIDVAKEAAASILEDKIIYRLLIHSDYAKSINLVFNPITLPSKAKMFLSRPDGGEIYGAYTNESFSGNVFATTPVSGDSVMIQCEVPISNADSFSAIIESVNVGFEELRLLPKHGSASDCETDVVCQNYGVENQSRAACLIIINGMLYCSGSLVATYDNDEASEAYVLTSAHCLRNNMDEFDSKLANKSIFYFGYSSSVCETSIIGSYEKSVSGSDVASSHPSKDMLLLKLSKRPPVDYMTYESGWNIELAPRGPATCIHHPNGNLMKISISDNNPYDYSYNINGLEPNNHWLVDSWAIGITERGSSGAPLYDNNGLIIGALSGGASQCNKRGGDKFWRLNNVWDDYTSQPSKLSSVLDPLSTGIMRLNGKDSYERRCYSLKNYDKFSEVTETYKDGYGYASGTNSIGIEEFAEKFTSDYSSTEIHGVSFSPILGTYDANKPVYLRIYTGDNKPETIVYESVVKITANEFTRIGAISSNVTNWSYKENYIRLDSVVTVGNTFFVSFYTDYKDVKFALLTASSDNHTAYFKQNGDWESFETHPFGNDVGSLLINAVVRDANGSGVKNIPNGDTDDDNYITVYPNPAKDQIHIKCPDEIKEIKIFNSAGKMESNIHGLDIKGLPNGIYSLEISTNKGKYHTKFIKE